MSPEELPMNPYHRIRHIIHGTPIPARVRLRLRVRVSPTGAVSARVVPEGTNGSTSAAGES